MGFNELAIQIIRIRAGDREEMSEEQLDTTSDEEEIEEFVVSVAIIFCLFDRIEEDSV